jgi:hypothetical protein
VGEGFARLKINTLLLNSTIFFEKCTTSGCWSWLQDSISVLKQAHIDKMTIIQIQMTITSMTLDAGIEIMAWKSQF